MQKKGVSPLVATVLLIAFAIALLAVILSWSEHFFSCINQPLIVTEINGKPDVCIVNNQIKISLENGRDANVAALTVTFFGDQIKNERMETSIPISEAKKIIMPFDPKEIGTLKKIKISPEIDKESGAKICSREESAIEIENIGPC